MPHNGAQVTGAATTLSAHNSQTAINNRTPQATPRNPLPPLSMRHHEWDCDLAHTGMGGHDAPNWSRMKSTLILLGATILYAIIAGVSLSNIVDVEILVDTVDSVLDSGSIDEKFLGFTLFALVPNAAEFLNAILFALNGNIALRCLLSLLSALMIVWRLGQHTHCKYVFCKSLPSLRSVHSSTPEK